MQIAIHANGDAAIDDVLDAFESAQKANPKKDIRHLLVHGNATRPDQLELMKIIGGVLVYKQHDRQTKQ